LILIKYCDAPTMAAIGMDCKASFLAAKTPHCGDNLFFGAMVKAISSPLFIASQRLSHIRPGNPELPRDP
jgi:hypothetical protein